MSNDLKLVYVHGLGESWDGDFIYQFLFSDSTENIDGENWDAMPASGKPTPPSSEKISAIGVLKSEYLFDLIQNSNYYRMWDGVDGVIGIAVENIDDYTEYPEKRMFFNFGMSKKEVYDILFRYDLELIYEENE